MLFPGYGGATVLTDTPPEKSGLCGLPARLAGLTADPVILEFCEFILGGMGGRVLPDYNEIDLMQAPRLAPHVFVHDYRDGTEPGMLVKFSGTAIDEHYGKVLQGRYLEEFYTGDDGPDRYFPLHRRAISERRPFFAARPVRYDEGTPRERRKQSTTLYFPCSSDGQVVNFGIGVVTFDGVAECMEPLYLIL
jgi:hypothetical protein